MTQTVHVVNAFHIYEVTDISGTHSEQALIGTGVGFTKESALEDLFKQDYFQYMLKDEIDFKTYWEAHEVK